MKKKTPVAPPKVDRATPSEVVAGMKLARKIIWQAEVGAPDALVQMVTRIATAKALGFTMFEVDVTPVRVNAPKSQEGLVVSLDVAAMFGYKAAVIDGEEWKNTADKRRNLIESHVLTVYALVVE